MHNMYVKSKVPAENLLVWNVKDGWGPLCTFLEKPIPEIPVPRENQSGDTQWGDDYLNSTDLFKTGFCYLILSTLLILILISGIICAIYFGVTAS